jgi:hypothetical protein
MSEESKRFEEVTSGMMADEAAPLQEELTAKEFLAKQQKNAIDRFGRIMSALQIKFAEDVDNALLKSESETYIKEMSEISERYNLAQTNLNLTESQIKELEDALTEVAKKYGIPEDGKSWINN